MYNACCPLNRWGFWGTIVVFNVRSNLLNCGIKLIFVVQAGTVVVFMQEISNSFVLLYYEDANCTVQGFAYVFDGLTFCKDENIVFSDELVICSLNARALSNTMKMREIFRWLKNKTYSIFLLQEVYCSKDKEIIWSAERGYTAIFSSLSSAKMNAKTKRA